MLVSKPFTGWMMLTSTFRGPRQVRRYLSSKDPLNDQDRDILRSNPYFGKYADKIKEMKKTCPEELTNRLALLLKKNTTNEKNLQHTQTKQRKLDDIMYIDQLRGKPVNEVQYIWENHMHGEHRFATTIHLDVYRRLEERGKLFPTFLYPLPRTTGFEFILSQFSGQEVHFSPLINYKMFRENAPECLSLTHFTDIAESSKLVLVLGEFNKDVLNVTEALCLYHQLQRYYGEDDPRRLRIIEQFHHAPLEFFHMDLIAELESLK